MPNAENDAPDNWLLREFERARKRREQLPKWARPVLVKKRLRVFPPGTGDTEASNESPA